MWVQTRTWSDNGYGRWHTGKIHWMVQPWVTLCGKEVGQDWTAYDGMPSVKWDGMCKQCGRGKR